MNTLHLLWIVPTAALLGFLIGALLASGENEQQDDDKPDVCKRCMCLHCPYNPSMTNDEIV